MTSGYGGYYRPGIVGPSREVAGDLADRLDPHAHAIAGREIPATRGAATRRRSGGDHVARAQREPRAEVGDLLGHREDEIGTRGVLHQLAVHPQPDLQVPEIVDLVQRTDPRPHRQCAVEALLAHPVEV